jgi:hypothetical protein
MDIAATFANVAIGISARFGGPYVPGRVIDQIDPTYDDGGSIVEPGGVSERDCFVQVDVATEAMRQSDGYVDGDARFLILSSTLSGSLGTDATVEVLGGPLAGAWLVSAIDRDPMGIYWQGRGRRA